MLKLTGFNGFNQLNSFVKTIDNEIVDGNSLNSSKSISNFHEINCLIDGFKLENIAISWSYCSVHCGSTLWMCGFTNGKENSVSKVETPLGHNINQMSCNRRLILCVMEDGGCWQYNLDKREWRDLKNILNSEQAEKSDIQKVSCGETVIAALSKSGTVFNIPNKLNIPKSIIVDIVCGRSHILMLSDKGEVYTVGEGSRGQLGHGELENEEEPRLVEGLAGIRIVSVASGGWHCCVLSADGDLYSWGWNMAGQLGLPANDSANAVSVLAIPQAVDWPDSQDVQVKEVACGARHTIALLDDGSVWGCGWNAYGQLALPGVENVDCMTRLPTPQPAQHIICGPWNSGIVC